MKLVLENTKTRFALVGGANTAIDFLILFILRFLGLPVIAANVVSTTTAFLFSFFANKKYTFKSTGSAKREFILFTTTTLFGLWIIQSIVIQLLVVFFEQAGLEQSYVLLLAKVGATLASLVWNYIMYSKVVFKSI